MTILFPRITAALVSILASAVSATTQEISYYEGSFAVGTDYDELAEVERVAYVMAQSNEGGMLLLACAEGDLMAAFRFGGTSYASSLPVRYRIDDGPVRQAGNWKPWNGIQLNRTLGHNGRSVEAVNREFLSGFKTGNVLRLQAAIGSVTHTHTFPLHGSSNALSLLPCWP